jgi:hypothetical protein
MEKPMRKRSRGIFVKFNLVGTLFLAVTGCSLPDCEYELGPVVTSPDGVLKAGIMTPGCGATTGDTHWVVLDRVENKLEEHRFVIAIFDGPVRALTWDGGTLVVHHGNSKPSTTFSLNSGTPITYRAD